MRNHLIPQELNIADRIGPFTVQQWAFIGGGLLLAMIIFILNIFNIIITLILASLSLGLGLVLGLYRIDDTPIYEFMFIYLAYRVRPKEYIYNSDRRLYIDFEEDEDYVKIDIY